MARRGNFGQEGRARAAPYVVYELEQQQLLFPTNGSLFCITGASFRRRSCLNLNNVISGAIMLLKTWLKNLIMLAYVSAIRLISSVALTAPLVWAGMADMCFHMAGSSLLKMNRRMASAIRN
uniref:Uncharacterized protein n=1 Tax=Oryza glumipatula TaxID=40148 RepID=A0A0E0ACG3_9ORYZ